MNKLLAIGAMVALSLCACTPAQVGPVANPPPISASVPIVSGVCAQISSDKFDIALKAYGVTADAIRALIPAVIKPGSAKAVAIANANDRVLSGFRTAEAARRACNATSYTAALAQVTAGLIEVKAALRS